jgi:hypothetical protein
MATQNTIEQQLLDLLVTKNFEPAMKDKNGQDARQTEDAKLFSFDYVGDSGKNYGTMVIVLDQDNDLKIMYGDNLGRTMAGDDKDKFFDFIMQINQVASRNRWTHTATDLNKLKYVQQGLAAIQEGLFEGYYGTRRVSYSGEPTEARLMIKHNHVLGENDKRYRYVESLFIETADSERFKLGFKNLAGGRAMLEHVRQGGKPYDIRGNHISEMVNEIGVLSRFNRASQGRVMEGVTAELITEAQTYYKSLRESLKRLGSTRGYAAYFESWHPAVVEPQEGLVEDIKTMFIEQTLDTRIEAALPVLARLQQGKTMKEANIFENWANRLTEGTWQLPDTPETKQQLADLLVNELPVGPDATNALEQLDGVLGDDQLYDQLEALAQEDANADARDVIRARMEEMGLEVPGSEADVEAEPGAEPAPMEPEQGVSEGVLDWAKEKYHDYQTGRQWNKFGKAQRKGDAEGMRAAQDAASAHRDKLQVARQNRTGSTLSKDSPMGVGQDVANLKALKAKGMAEGSSCNMTMEGDYCPEHGLMECGMHEGAFHNPEQTDSPAAQAITRRILLQRTDLLSKYGPEKVGQAIDEVADFIGDVEEIGSSDVSGWVRHVEQMLGNMGDDVGEGVDDPINYNGAITGSYYEDKQDPLARIKSLALLK